MTDAWATLLALECSKGFVCHVAAMCPWEPLLGNVG